MIIETCPKCGKDLLKTVICTYPPIPKWQCECGWSHEGERERIVRVPFNAVTSSDTGQCDTNPITKLSSGTATSIISEMDKKRALEVLDQIPTIGEQVDALEMAIEALENSWKADSYDNLMAGINHFGINIVFITDKNGDFKRYRIETGNDGIILGGHK